MNIKRSLLCLLLLPLALCALLNFARASDKESLEDDARKLRSSYQPVDGPGLITFLRTRAQGVASQERLAKLLEALESKEPSKREAACAEMVAIGPPAIPVLRQAARDGDLLQSAKLAQKLLKILEDNPGQLSTSAIRHLARGKPAGAARALLDYLPHAETEAVKEELKSALSALAQEGGRASPALLEALQDEDPLKRASAIAALSSRGRVEPQATLRKLLSDPSPSVRLQASLALAQGHDARAIDAMIALLGELSPSQSREVLGFLTSLAGEHAPLFDPGTSEADRLKTRDAWSKWWQQSEGTGLVAELRKRTITDLDSTAIQGLIDKLGDDSFEVRQKSEEELTRLGIRIVPLLRKALMSSDLEVRTRALKCLTAIEMQKATPLSPVTVRLLAFRKPTGAVEAILAFLPFNDDEQIAEELQTALESMAYSGGKASLALLKALEDRVPARRAAAGQALSRGTQADHRRIVLPLLKDRDPHVRLRVALGLLGAGESTAVSTLIELTGGASLEIASQAEDYLLRLAEDDPPNDLPEGEGNRKKRSEVWEKWWQDHKDRIALVDPGSLTSQPIEMGHMVLINQNPGILFEWNRDRKVLWSISGLAAPWDATRLPGNRILVAEYNAQRITERNLMGKILWQVALPSYPMQVERLPSGRTFVVCRNMLLLLDRRGKEVQRINRPNDVLTARRLRSGQVQLVTQNRQIIRLDRTGKELGSAAIPQHLYQHLYEILDNGNILTPLGFMNSVVEYNSEGKEVWRCTVPQPTYATRLPNGNTLVSSQNWPNRIYEIDRKGNQVGDYLTHGTTIFRIRRR